MNNRENLRVICKEFTIRRQAIRQVVYINVEQKRSQNSEVDHLITPFDFGIFKNLLKDSTGFQIYHYSLILELVLHVKLYQWL